MRPFRANVLATIVAASSVACSNAATMQRATGAPTLTAADTAFVDTLSKRTFEFFWQTTNPRNGLDARSVADASRSRASRRSVSP